MIPGATLADSKGARRIKWLEQRVALINHQIAEMEDKKAIMLHEIETISTQMRTSELVR